MNSGVDVKHWSPMNAFIRKRGRIAGQKKQKPDRAGAQCEFQ